MSALPLFELLLFKGTSLEAFTGHPDADVALHTFVDLCYEHINPQFFPQNYVKLSTTLGTISYCSLLNGDPSSSVRIMLVGPYTHDMFISIRQRLAAYYASRCDECGAITDDHDSSLCRLCSFG